MPGSSIAISLASAAPKTTDGRWSDGSSQRAMRSTSSPATPTTSGTSPTRVGGGSRLPVESKVDGATVRRFPVKHLPLQRYFGRLLSYAPHWPTRCVAASYMPILPGIGRVRGDYDAVFAVGFPYTIFSYAAYLTARAGRRSLDPHPVPPPGNARRPGEPGLHPAPPDPIAGRVGHRRRPDRPGRPSRGRLGHPRFADLEAGDGRRARRSDRRLARALPDRAGDPREVARSSATWPPSTSTRGPTTWSWPSPG